MSKKLFLFDTNTISDLIKNNEAGLAIRERLSTVSPLVVAISVITEAELRFGLQKSPPTARIYVAVQQILSDIDILQWDSEAAIRYALLRTQSEKLGIVVGSLDLLIAAQAAATSRTLVTRDRGLRRLRKWVSVESWSD